MSLNQTTILEDLAYLVGETSVPTAGIDNRKRFIQRTLEEATSYAEWDWNKATATVAIAAGVASLPSTVLVSPNLDVRIVRAGTNDDNIFTQIPYSEQDQYGSGDYRYWLTGTEGSYVVNTKADDATLTVRFDKVAPQINASVTTDFPSSLVIAQGALRFYRSSTDPEYDISQDQAVFEKGLSDLVAAQNRNHPKRKAKTAQSVAGTYTGAI